MTATHLRLHHDARRDVKLRAVAAAVGLPYAHVLGAWAGLLIDASAARPRGWIREESIDTLAEDLDLQPVELRRIVAEMVANRLLTAGGAGWHVRKWMDRQGIRFDSTNADRQRRFRQRQREEVTAVIPVTAVTTADDVTPVTGVTTRNVVTCRAPLNRTTTSSASALRRETEESLSLPTEARAERRANAPKGEGQGLGAWAKRWLGVGNA